MLVPARVNGIKNVADASLRDAIDLPTSVITISLTYPPLFHCILIIKIISCTRDK